MHRPTHARHKQRCIPSRFMSRSTFLACTRARVSVCAAPPRANSGGRTADRYKASQPASAASRHACGTHPPPPGFALSLPLTSEKPDSIPARSVLGVPPHMAVCNDALYLHKHTPLRDSPAALRRLPPWIFLVEHTEVVAVVGAKQCTSPSLPHPPFGIAAHGWPLLRAHQANVLPPRPPLVQPPGASAHFSPPNPCGHYPLQLTFWIPQQLQSHAPRVVELLCKLVPLKRATCACAALPCSAPVS
mmetsp:Transcript_122/g.265  ORF Transcript_122/g.265 Transcript_122/m.265 type:complete len:246 (-) Transcript_122:60-797(-)